MQTLQNSTRGLGLIVDMAWDRFLFSAAIGFALAAASYLGHLAVPAAF
ncbi:MAG: hypothetical protein AAFR53_04580 [Pseudomonadota bacterium]